MKTVPTPVPAVKLEDEMLKAFRLSHNRLNENESPEHQTPPSYDVLFRLVIRFPWMLSRYPWMVNRYQNIFKQEAAKKPDTHTLH